MPEQLRKPSLTKKVLAGIRLSYENIDMGQICGNDVETITTLGRWLKRMDLYQTQQSQLDTETVDAAQ